MYRSVGLVILAVVIALVATAILNSGQNSLEKPVPNNLIAFVSDRDSNLEIYLTDPSGAEVRNISNSPAIDFFPVWSPDKNYLAFISNRDHSDSDRNGDIILFNVNDSTLLNLTPGDEDEYLPSWSPDGRLILFMRNVEQDNDITIMDVFTVDINSMEIRKITNGEPIRNRAVWSPDSKQIAFSSEGENTEGQRSYEIFLVNADGSNMRTLITSDIFYDDLRWSPDGAYLSYIDFPFTSDEERRDASLQLLRVSNSEILFLDTPRLAGITTEWSPDSRKIAFVGYVSEDNSDIFIWDIETSNVTQLEHEDTHDFSPVWSPDGLQIASFFEPDDEGYSILYIHNLADSQNSYPIEERGFRLGSETWWELFLFQQLDW